MTIVYAGLISSSKSPDIYAIATRLLIHLVPIFLFSGVKRPECGDEISPSFTGVLISP